MNTSVHVWYTLDDDKEIQGSKDYEVKGRNALVFGNGASGKF